MSRWSNAANLVVDRRERSKQSKKDTQRREKDHAEKERSEKFARGLNTLKEFFASKEGKDAMFLLKVTKKQIRVAVKKYGACGMGPINIAITLKGISDVNHEALVELLQDWSYKEDEQLNEPDELVNYLRSELDKIAQQIEQVPI